MGGIYYLETKIIKDHLFDTFELSGKSLLTASDEMTEATHSALYDETHKSFKCFVCLSLEDRHAKL